MLDYARDTVHVKCAGLSEEEAHRAPLPGSPLMTIAGVVSHLRWVEYYWFDVILQAKSDEAPWTDDDPDREMRIGRRVRFDAATGEYTGTAVPQLTGSWWRGWTSIRSRGVAEVAGGAGHAAVDAACI